MCEIYYSCTGFETHRLTVKPQVILSVFGIVSILRGLWGDSMGTLWQILVLCSWINLSQIPPCAEWISFSCSRFFIVLPQKEDAPMF